MLFIQLGYLPGLSKILSHSELKTGHRDATELMLASLARLT